MSAYTDHAVDELIERYGVKTIKKKLIPFLTEQRKARLEEVLASRLTSVQVCMESPHDVHNAMAVVRSAEAFGVSHIHLIDTELRKRRGKGTTKGSVQWTHMHLYSDLDHFLQKRPDGYKLCGASLEGSVPLSEVPVDEPLILLFGNEKRGLSPEAIEACDLTFQIPMVGMVESLNLSVSAGIAVREVAERRRQRIGRSGDLEGEELELEHAFFLLRGEGIPTAKKYLEAMT